MHLLLVGISHRTAPIELRERVDFQARGLEHALRTLAARSRRHAAGEMAVLSTCNRAELYVACDDVETARAELVVVRRSVSRRRRRRRSSRTSTTWRTSKRPGTCSAWPPASTRSSSANRRFSGRSKKRTAPPGTPQPRGRCSTACSTRRSPSASACGRKPGSAPGAVSVSYAAVALAKKIFGNLDGRAVVVIGAGEMGKLTAQHMKSQGVRHVTIVSRTMAHAARTADAIGGATAAPWDDMDAALAASDIVITATGAAAPILTKARIEAAMRPRRNRPLFIIDIAVPRDVEAAAGEIEQVFLYNIDDLQATVRENMARRTSEVTRAEAIVDEELDKFGSWMRARGVDSDRRRAASVVRGDPPRRARPARLQAVRAAARGARRGARPRGRDHAPDRREAAADADRAAQVPRRSGDRRASTRRRSRGCSASPTSRTERGVQDGGDGDTQRRASGRPRATVPARQNARTALTWRTRPELRLGTRGSQLALWQARAVAAPIAERGGPPCRIVVIKTSGDRAGGPAAVGSRRQAALRQGNRRRAAPERRRPGRPQQQGHAGRPAGRPGHRRRAAARGSARRRRAAGQRPAEAGR